MRMTDCPFIKDIQVPAVTLIEMGSDILPCLWMSTDANLLLSLNE